MEEMVWKDDYNVGCDFVDKAHQKLFSVLRRVERLLQEQDYEKNKFACIEAVKFLYNYTETHFAQEEGFMRQVGYDGYEMHKKLHDDMKLVTVPALDRAMVESDYSRESIQEFIGIFAGWLMGHILIEDLAITGKATSCWRAEAYTDSDVSLDEEVRRLMKEVSDIDVSLITNHYDGTPIEDGFYYEMNFTGSRVIFAAKKDIIVRMAGDITGLELKVLDRTAMVTFVQFAQSVARKVLSMISPGESFELKSHRSITPEILKSYYSDTFPGHSIKWNTPCGSMALCVK